MVEKTKRESVHDLNIRFNLIINQYFQSDQIKSDSESIFFLPDFLLEWIKLTFLLLLFQVNP